MPPLEVTAGSREPDGILLRPCEARVLEFQGVVPDLLTSLAQEPFGAKPLQWREQSVEHGCATRCRELVILCGDPGRENLVDAFVIASTPVHHDGMGEVVVADQ